LTVNLVVVAGLIVLNGLFALAELAVVSARRARLKALIEAGRPGAKSALALHDNPGRFLSSVQIGITLVGIVNGAFSAEAFGAAATGALTALGVNEATAAPLGYGAIVLVVTYLSVVMGELVPKSLALRNPEAIACAVAPPMTMFARLAGPAIGILDASTRLVMRLLGRGDVDRTDVTDEEIKSLIAEAESAGVVETKEKDMIAGVMRLADRRVAGVMTPRNELDWIDLTDPPETIRQTLIKSVHGYLPAAEESLDQVIGVIRTRDALAGFLADLKADTRKVVRPVTAVPETAASLDVMEQMRKAETPVAFVHDEYGNLEGLVTPADILETIAGGFAADLGSDEPYAKQRRDGSWLLSGAMAADETAELLAFDLPDKRDYQALAGYMLERFRRLPQVGDCVTAGAWRLEVVDMDGNRIDTLLATPADRTHRAGATADR